jgi:hypothetical protein
VIGAGGGGLFVSALWTGSEGGVVVGNGGDMELVGGLGVVVYLGSNWWLVFERCISSLFCKLISKKQIRKEKKRKEREKRKGNEKE